jgi:UDP-GlcNAc:undecaprenyl-phosphate GlcNAc-1-phosphate transferase
MPHLLTFLVSIAVSAAVTPLIMRLAMRVGAVDRPDAGRKRHARPTPLLGGLAVFAGITVALVVALVAGWLPAEHIEGKHVAGIILAMALLAFGGAWDDVRRLKPSLQIFWPLVAVLVIIASGVGISTVTNPFGGLIHLDPYRFTVLWWQGIPYRITPFADLFTLVWLMTMTYTTKLLDGLDGLVAGIAVIGGLVIAAVSFLGDVHQPDTALLALAVAGAFAGVLFFNFYPARIFLGESGSVMAGFLLATLAIISGGKIATTLLVLGLPLFDAATVVLRRLFRERTSPFSGDRLHLHFRLLDWGFTERQAVLIFYFVATLFGTSTLFLHGSQKVVALGVVLSLAAFSIAAWSVTVGRRRKMP